MRLPPAALLAACLALTATVPSLAQPRLPPVAGSAPTDPASGLGLPTAKPAPLPPGPDPFFGGAAPGGAMSGGGAPARRAVSSGTGFVVAPGRLMTNWHVVEGCAEIRLRTARRAELTATLAARDEQRDLALLAVAGELGPPLPFRAAPEVRRGEGVVTFGFPLSGMLSSGATLTTGDISALSGLRDNPRHFQISAPVQSGNSGGPLLDLGGRVIGVVVSKLNAQRISQVTGDLPQNVNFAVKGTEALDFLHRRCHLGATVMHRDLKVPLPRPLYCPYLGPYLAPI